MIRKKYALLVLLAALLAVVAFPVPVGAIAQPDSPPQINGVYVYSNLAETGDVGILVDYYLDYAVLPTIANPDDTVTAAYLVVFIDVDATTQLKSASPYTYHDSGYGRGQAWIYFTAAEATAASLDSTDEALYRIWLVGNPTITSGWTGDPPKTVSTINQWIDTGDGDPNVLLGQKILYYAAALELAWTLDMVQATSTGNKLTSYGEEYYDNVISGARTIAPGAYAASTIKPTQENIDYTTGFGATLYNGSGTAAGAPITLAAGNNNVNVTALGTFTIVLTQGTVGTANSDVCTVNGSPATLVAGTNTITTAVLIGNIIITVNQSDTTTAVDDSVTGTGFDLTTIAATFGMSRWWFSGIVWLIMSVMIMAAVYRVTPDRYGMSGAGKAMFPIFMVCIIGGILMGLLKPVVGIVMFIGLAGFFVSYILFFRGSSA